MQPGVKTVLSKIAIAKRNLAQLKTPLRFRYKVTLLKNAALSQPNYTKLITTATSSLLGKCAKNFNG